MKWVLLKTTPNWFSPLLTKCFSRASKSKTTVVPCWARALKSSSSAVLRASRAALISASVALGSNGATEGPLGRWLPRFFLAFRPANSERKTKNHTFGQENQLLKDVNFWPSKSSRFLSTAFCAAFHSARCSALALRFSAFREAPVFSPLSSRSAASLWSVAASSISHVPVSSLGNFGSKPVTVTASKIILIYIYIYIYPGFALWPMFMNFGPEILRPPRENLCLMQLR